MPLRHPSSALLADFAEGQLSAEHASASQHITACSRCTATVAWMQRTIQMMRTDDLPAAPAHLVARAARIAQRQRLAAPAPAPVERPRLIERLVGVLRFDSAQAAPAFGLRSGTTQPARQLVFEAGPYEVDLRIGFERDSWVLIGQVLGAEDAEPGQVELNGEAADLQTELSDLHEFKLARIPMGRYHFQLHMATADVYISPLEVGP